MNEREIIERVMTAHWDMAACQCWLCKEARSLGLRPREEYLTRGGTPSFPQIEDKDEG